MEGSLLPLLSLHVFIMWIVVANNKLGECVNKGQAHDPLVGCLLFINKRGEFLIEIGQVL